MIFRLYNVYDKHKVHKLAIKQKKNRKYYNKCTNNFDADCMVTQNIVT